MRRVFRYVRRTDDYYYRVIENNRLVAAWMVIPLVISFFMVIVTRDVVWGLAAVLCLLLIESLRNGWTQAMIMLEVRRRG